LSNLFGPLFQLLFDFCSEHEACWVKDPGDGRQVYEINCLRAMATDGLVNHEWAHIYIAKPSLGISLTPLLLLLLPLLLHVIPNA
jgi:hypothetical protein